MMSVDFERVHGNKNSIGKSESQPPRRSLNLPLANAGESNGIRRLREENRRILGKKRIYGVR